MFPGQYPGAETYKYSLSLIRESTEDDEDYSICPRNEVGILANTYPNFQTFRSDGNPSAGRYKEFQLPATLPVPIRLWGSDHQEPADRMARVLERREGAYGWH